MSEENGEGDKGGQGLPLDSDDRLKGDAGKKGAGATAEDMPMEEDPPGAPDPTGSRSVPIFISIRSPPMRGENVPLRDVWNGRCVG